MSQFTRESCKHLSDLEWAALERMSMSIGTAGVGALLKTLSHDAQHASIAQFIQNELDAAQLQVSELSERAAGRKPRVETLKVDVSKFRGAAGESLLRWFVELEAAMIARCIESDSMQVTFAMSHLAGRAKTWAFGRKMANANCFPTYQHLKQELQNTFEPPKTEFRARAEFLSMRQGKRDIHAYAQYARHLVSCIVSQPIDDMTQVVTFMAGLQDGPVKTHLFRVYPETLEQAISLAIQEDFNLQQAYVHSAAYKPKHQNVSVHSDGAEPMELCAVNAGSPQQSKKGVTCNRCQQRGHFAYECVAPRPVPRKSSGGRGNAGPRRNQSTSGGNQKHKDDSESKNSQSQ
jgi:Retrotransposon gag protein